MYLYLMYNFQFGVEQAKQVRPLYPEPVQENNSSEQPRLKLAPNPSDLLENMSWILVRVLGIVIGPISWIARHIKLTNF